MNFYFQLKSQTFKFCGTILSNVTNDDQKILEFQFYRIIVNLELNINSGVEDPYG